MTSKPFLRALQGERLPRPPFWLMRQAGRYLPEYRAVRAEAGSFLDLCYNPALAAEVTLQPIRRFGMDAAILFSDILVVPHALSQPLRYVEGEGPKLDAVTNARDLSRLTSDRLHEVLAPIYETVRRVRAALPDEVALIGFAGAPWTVASYMVEGGGSRDFAAVKRFAYQDPAGFGALIDLLVTATVDYLAAQAEAGAEALQLFDSWAGVLPESAFARWSIAPTRRIVEGLRQRGVEVPIIGFPKGAGALYERYVAETGVTAVGLDTSVPLGWAADRLQSRMPVQGNLDPVMLMAGGEALETEAKSIIEGLSGGPHIFNLGHGVLQHTPPEHVGLLADLIRGGEPA